jgi:selenocysteine lyase/cysteine desulfurase
MYWGTPILSAIGKSDSSRLPCVLNHITDSSRLSSTCADEARAAVLSFFQAPPEYTVVFTANATGALKLVGESFPFHEGSSFVLGVDSHNSVHGIREYASRRGARVSYIPSTSRGGVVYKTAIVKYPSVVALQILTPRPSESFVGKQT